MTDLNPVLSTELDQSAARSAFFTRPGGVSEGIYSGLNVGLGSDDNRENVLQNRAKVAHHMNVPATSLLSPYQIHSPDVLAVDADWPEGYRPKVDALVTKTPGLAIGVLTADCGPVLFLDAENKVAGAAHAGWKGATGGVLENTVSAMETLGAERDRIVAVLGPTISSANYEVGPEFVDRLIELDSKNEAYLSPSTNPDHAMFDLPSYIVARLKGEGITASWTGNCTYADEENFFSYRRTTHRAESDYGRQISAISLL